MAEITGMAPRPVGRALTWGAPLVIVGIVILTAVAMAAIQLSNATTKLPVPIFWRGDEEQ